MVSQLTNNHLLLKECIKQEYEEVIGYSDVNTCFEHFATA